MQSLAQHLQVSSDTLIACSGTSEGYALIYKMLANAGDNIVLPRPSYPLLAHLVELEGLEPRFYDIAFEGSWHIDRASVHKAIDANSRAIVVVSPNNPTGHCFAADELAFLAQFERPILCDQVFQPYTIDDQPAESATTILNRLKHPLVLSLDGASKRFASPHLKLSWIQVSGQEPFRQQALDTLRVLSDCYLSVSAQAYARLPSLMEQGPQIQARLHEGLHSNLTLLHERLRGQPISLLPCHAGWNAILHVPNILSDEAWAIALIEEEQLYTHPGYLYDLAPSSMLVVSLLLAPAQTQMAIKRLLRCCDRHIA